jgi:ribosome-binding factor A
VSSQDFKRSQRVGELVQHELAGLISNELKDPRVGFVTVTEVRLSGDLRQAKVFVSVYGDENQRKASLEGLERAAGFLKREVGRRLGLRVTPELSFEHDDTLATASRLEAIMNAISHGETEPPNPAMTAPVPVDTHRSALANRERDFAARRAEKPRRPKNKRGRR